MFHATPRHADKQGEREGIAKTANVLTNFDIVEMKKKKLMFSECSKRARQHAKARMQKFSRKIRNKRLASAARRRPPTAYRISFILVRKRL